MIPRADGPGVEEYLCVARANRERILVRLVTAISRRCIMIGSRSTSHFGLSMSQVIVLGELFVHGGCRQEDLRGYVALDKGNVTRALQRLEEYGLVQREQDPADRRVVRVYVTPKAQAIEREMYALAARWDETLMAGFTQEECKTVVDLLLRMEANARVLARDEGVLAGTSAT